MSRPQQRGKHDLYLWPVNLSTENHEEICFNFFLYKSESLPVEWCECKINTNDGISFTFGDGLINIVSSGVWFRKRKDLSTTFIAPTCRHWQERLIQHTHTHSRKNIKAPKLKWHESDPKVNAQHRYQKTAIKIVYSRHNYTPNI